MKKYKITSICTLTGKIKNDKDSIARVGKVGYVDICKVNKNDSCMMFIVNDGGYTGFITSKVTDIEKDFTRNWHKMIITTLNSIYFLEEVCD